MKKGPLSARLGSTGPNVFPTEEVNGSVESPRSFRESLRNVLSQRKLAADTPPPHVNGDEDLQDEPQTPPPPLPTAPPPPQQSVPRFPEFILPESKPIGPSGDSLWNTRGDDSPPPQSLLQRRNHFFSQQMGAGEPASSRRSEASTADFGDAISQYPPSSRPYTPGAIHPLIESDPVEPFVPLEDDSYPLTPTTTSDPYESPNKTLKIVQQQPSVSGDIGYDIDNKKSLKDFSVIMNEANIEDSIKLREKLQKLFRAPGYLCDNSSSYDCWRDGEDYDDESVVPSKLQVVGHIYEMTAPNPDSYTYKLLLSGVVGYSQDFVNIPTQPGFTIKCKIVRVKQGVEGSFYPLYVMYLERPGQANISVLVARKRKKALSTSYIIGTDVAGLRKDSNSCVGILNGNFKRSKFDLFSPVSAYDSFDSDARPGATHLLSVSFNEEERLGSRSPRMIRVAAPKLKEDYIRMIQGGDKKVRIGDDEFIQLKNREPTWSQSSGTYVLNFNNRVTKSSIKNFILTTIDVDTKDHNILLFGKNSKDAFTLDFSYPLCPLQAFATALASFDVKWGME